MANNIMGTFAPMAAQIGSVLIIVLVGFLLLGAMLGLLYYVRKSKGYNRDVIIFRKKHNGGFSIEFDKGGYLKNMNGEWKFKLKKNRKWLSGEYGEEISKEGGGNVLFLFRDSSDTFFHVNPELIFRYEDVYDENGEPMYELDKNGEIIYDKNNKPKHLKRIKLNISVTGEDVEWAKESFNQYTVAYTKKDMLREMIPVIGMGIFVVVVIVIFYLILQKFDVLQNVSSNLIQVANALKEAKLSTVISNAPK